MDLEVQRETVQANLQKAIEDLATPILASYCKNQYALAHAYFQGLYKSGLWPLSEKLRQSSLSTIMERMTRFPGINKNGCTCRMCDVAYKFLLSDMEKKHLSSVTGLCLDCVKDGGSGLKGDNRNCRFEHS